MPAKALWKHHIFVCCNERDPDHPRPSCGRTHGEAVRAWFKQGIKKRGLQLTVRANKAGCLEGCEAGPSVVIYPDAVWYRVRTASDVERILDEHIIGGTPVAALYMDLACLPTVRARDARKCG